MNTRVRLVLDGDRVIAVRPPEEAPKPRPTGTDQPSPAKPVVAAMLLLFALAVAIPTASAAQAPVKQADGPTATGLTINDCLTILQGLEKLDEKRSIILNKGKPNEQVVQDYNEYPRPGVQLDISHNVALLSAIRRDLQPEQQRTFYRILRTVPDIKAPRPGEQAGPATAIPPGSPQDEEFQAKMRELTDRPCTAQITPLKAEDLDVDKNRIPVGTLSLIDRVLVR